MTARTILTMSNGKGIDLLDPRPEQIDFASIAEHLAKEKRYNGATPETEYSVAQHCCIGADAILASGMYAAESVAAFFLLHDAHEALVKDLTTPLKEAVAHIAQEHYAAVSADVINSFGMLEERVNAAIYTAAGFTWPLLPQFKQDVKRFDLIMFVTEWRDLMRGAVHPNWHPYEGIKPLAEVIKPWSWEVARTGWHRRAEKLFPNLRKEAA